MVLDLRINMFTMPRYFILGMTFVCSLAPSRGAEPGVIKPTSSPECLEALSGEAEPPNLEKYDRQAAAQVLISRFEPEFLRALAEAIASEVSAPYRSEVTAALKELMFGDDPLAKTERLERLTDSAILRFLDSAGRSDKYSKMSADARASFEKALTNGYRGLREFVEESLSNGFYSSEIADQFPIQLLDSVDVNHYFRLNLLPHFKVFLAGDELEVRQFPILPVRAPPVGMGTLLNETMSEATIRTLQTFAKASSADAFDYFVVRYLDQLPPSGAEALLARFTEASAVGGKLDSTRREIEKKRTEFRRILSVERAVSLGNEMTRGLGGAIPVSLTDLALTSISAEHLKKLESFVNDAADEGIDVLVVRFADRLPANALEVVLRRAKLISREDPEFTLRLDRLTSRRITLERYAALWLRFKSTGAALEAYRAQQQPSELTREIEVFLAERVGKKSETLGDDLGKLVGLLRGHPRRKTASLLIGELDALADLKDLPRSGSAREALPLFRSDEVPSILKAVVALATAKKFKPKGVVLDFFESIRNNLLDPPTAEQRSEITEILHSIEGNFASRNYVKRLRILIDEPWERFTDRVDTLEQEKQTLDDELKACETAAAS